MSGSVYGTIFKISTWGESHGAGVGVVVDGCPAGLPLNEEDIQKYLDRRKPGQSKFTMQIIPLMKSMAFVITGAADVLPEERPLEEWQQVL